MVLVACSASMAFGNNCATKPIRSVGSLSVAAHLSSCSQLMSSFTWKHIPPSQDEYCGLAE